MQWSQESKKATDVDKHVGKRLRTLREACHLSQEKFGDALGISFQQVQKYETGKNRIGASRLYHMSKILLVSVAEFFEGAPDPPEARKKQK